MEIKPVQLIFLLKKIVCFILYRPISLAIRPIRALSDERKYSMGGYTLPTKCVFKIIFKIFSSDNHMQTSMILKNILSKKNSGKIVHELLNFKR